MYKKIQYIRKYLELTETQISCLLNVSSYKYKRFENGTIEPSSENLILISLAYNVPIDYLLFSKYSIDDIISLPSIVALKKQNLQLRLSNIEKTICSHSLCVCSAVNYKVIKDITKQHILNFKSNLYYIRTREAIEINTISKALKINPKKYLLFEKGNTLPEPLVLVEIATLFNTSVEKLLSKQKDV